MPDNELQIVTTLDPSGIRAGAEQSSDAVKKSTSEMKQGFADSGNASKEAADKMNYSMTEARHSIMELGAETGVRPSASRGQFRCVHCSCRGDIGSGIPHYRCGCSY
jgi:hypothetical protein